MNAMNAMRMSPLVFALLLLSACVTINVYFPAAAAEAAADRIIKDVYGEQPAEPAAQPEPSSRNQAAPSLVVAWVGDSLAWLVPAAEAAPNIDVTSPGIQQLKGAMAQRHQQLAPHYDAGAVGMTADGEIALRDRNAVALKDRQRVNAWVAAENRDRAALYAEIARANGHPEWESDIRKTFARRWIDNAPSGWWYQDPAGNWTRK